MDYEGPVLTPMAANRSSANNHLTNVSVYVYKELGQRAMLGSFDHTPFVPQCQTNPILTQPNHWIIMDLSLPHPPAHTINGATPKDMFLGRPLKMRLLSAEDLANLI